ncbi:MAG TPA: metal-dependent hydrolase [Candidatus Sulfotelmatobacter sp.]|nr:metal-dependent hydrolase [Candidatus Sulfotelmatobacter sp.]
MDTITHGIAGALISKAVFGGRDLISAKEMEKKRLTTWVLVIGAMFPDIDVLREFFDHNPMLIVTWHRSITHSLLIMPIWSLGLAAFTAAIARWRKWQAPNFWWLTLLYAVGIFSHIVLDLLTDFGTMIWSPLGWSRPAWDVLFIIDLTLTAILLIPQWMAWAFEDPDHVQRRATILWAIFTPAPLVISRLALAVGVQISTPAVLLATVLFTVLFLLPAARGWGINVPYEKWNRIGLALAVVYIAAAAVAHHTALERVEQFAAAQKIDAQSIGALPLPPSLWHWDGLVRAPDGVYETRLDLSDTLFQKRDPKEAETITRTFYPDALPNEFTEAARRLPAVQEVLWFARFPVIQFHKEGDVAVVEISDKRFPQINRNRPASFTYQVRFSPTGKVLTQGWLRR